MEAAKLSAPSAARNREPILRAIEPFLPRAGLVLEIASGTGEHVGFFADALPGLTWQPSDPAADRRDSIAAWTAGLANVRPPLPLDAVAADWPVARADAVLCINMIHIAPPAATTGLLAGAARVLPSGGVLVLYGPFRRRGEAMEPGNAAFDADLKRRDPAWGLREVEAVTAAAAEAGLIAAAVLPMPADNLTLIFRRV